MAIIKKLGSSEKMVNVAHTFNMTRSTVGMIYKKQRPYCGTCEECSAYAIYYYQQEMGEVNRRNGKTSQSVDGALVAVACKT